MVLLAFVTMSLAWSFSWFAGKLQVNSFVPIELSAFYRFTLTTILMFVLCLITKQRLSLKKSEWRFFLIIGSCNFCLNFVIGYYAMSMIASGVVATIFSLSILLSELISSALDGRKVSTKIILSGIIGMLGLAFFILPSIQFDHFDSKMMMGIFLSLVMATIYSVGNVAVVRNKRVNDTPLYVTIAYGSLFGALAALLINIARGNEFVFDYSISYIGSLLYLVVIASVLAFICLFYMIQKIGSARANYTSLIYPTIALIISSFFESFHFSFFNIIGLMLITTALAIEFIPKHKHN